MTDDAPPSLPTLSLLAAFPTILLALLLAITTFLPGQNSTQIGFFTAALSTQGTFLIVALLSAWCAKTPLRIWFKVRRVPVPRVLFEAFFLFCNVFLAAVVSAGLLFLLRLEGEQQVVFSWFENQPPHLLALMALIICVLTPICEEFFFRGILYNALRRPLGEIGGTAVAAALFAVVHGNLFAFFPLFMVAFCLTHAYKASGTLWLPIFLHALFNAVNLSIWFLKEHYGL